MIGQGSYSHCLSNTKGGEGRTPHPHEGGGGGLTLLVTCCIHLFRHDRYIYAFFFCTARDVHGWIGIGGELATERAPSRLKDSQEWDQDRNNNKKSEDEKVKTCSSSLVAKGSSLHPDLPHLDTWILIRILLPCFQIDKLSTYSGFSK